MHQLVEILVANDSRQRIATEFEHIGEVSVRSRPSHKKSIHRLLFTTVPDFLVPNRLQQIQQLFAAVGKMRRQRTSELIPLVLSEPNTIKTGNKLILSLQLIADMRQEWLSKESTECYVAPDPAALRRLIFSRIHQAEAQLIASAALLGRELLVWSCEPKLYRVEVDKIPSLATLSEASLQDFSVSTSGSRIHWAQADIDINLETIRERIDPTRLKYNQQLARREAARYGAAIRQLRNQYGLKQTDIPGVGEREIRRLEKGGVMPHSETLKKLAAAHRMHVEKYVAQLAKLTAGMTKEKR